MYCAHCGSEVIEGGRFCHNCGEKIEFRSSSKTESGICSKLGKLELKTGVDGHKGPCGLVFNRIPAGFLVMGSAEDAGGTPREVRLTEDFWIAKTPITQKQWMAVMEEGNPSRFKEGGEDVPVEQVSWEDAQAFCAKLNEKEPDAEWEYGLPTEAEWEYACRAGTEGPFNVAGAELGELGWFGENSESQPHPVKEKLPNSNGLYDCHGNVFEWCQDRFQEKLSAEAQTNPEGADEGRFRVIRGGCWDTSAKHCRSDYRGKCFPGKRSGRIGFRPVRRQKPKPGEGPELENRVGMKMIRLRAGTFTTGLGNAAYPVTLSEDFYIAETPVTQGQWEELMGYNPSEFKAIGPEGPVESVSFYEAVAFCRKLNRDACTPKGWEYALPTQAQWEYARRAGMATAHWWGDKWKDGKANVANGPICDYQKKYFISRLLPTESTMPVRTFQPNPWGLFDMDGNVSEWCVELFVANEVQMAPQGPYQGHERCVLGNSWLVLSDVSPASRGSWHSWPYWPSDCGGSDPEAGHKSIGFRPVLQRITVEPKARARSEEVVSADYTNSVGMEMLHLPAGKFLMGSPRDEVGREPFGLGESQYPPVTQETQHEVTLSESIWMGKTPVTQGQWKQIMGTGINEQKGKAYDIGNVSEYVTGIGDNHPMYFVSWEEALRFCDKLTERELEAGQIQKEYAYTLPTEAQWEYGCRAGTTGAYAGGGLDEMGWYVENSGKTTHPVGKKAENP